VARQRAARAALRVGRDAGGARRNDWRGVSCSFERVCFV
jgi:hypothetical protein